ncbi:hypothetical protein KPH14_006947 [Odynerus spinipes]|uniref:Beta-taxilin n=1 Tax=Odynerus spinipes TaxID=1348599 RepID=A0AAD9RST0_9HYME|nr:hypothetical protein KPH14_006947 [Odynerus spinipes]
MFVCRLYESNFRTLWSTYSRNNKRRVFREVPFGFSHCQCRSVSPSYSHLRHCCASAFSYYESITFERVVTYTRARNALSSCSEPNVPMMDEKINDNTSNDESPSTEKKNEVKSIDRAKDRKRSKEEKSRKREMKKAAEQFLEAVNDVQTLEEKWDVMCKKYSEIMDDNKRLLLNLKQSEKKIMLLQREKEQFQSERNKALLTRKRLENLCRELQKQNKAVKEECLLRLKREEEKRKEVSAKFQNTLVQINQHMNLSLEKNAKMQEENLEMNKMFKSVCDEVALKEKQLLSVHVQMKADLHVARAKLEEVKIEATTEKEALLKEKQQLLLKLTEYQTQIQELQATEAALKSQINIYTDKYDEFQNSLSRSNKVCGEFNDEMERMSKKILALEKETSLWKQRWEKSHAVFLEMATEKQARESELTTLKKRLSLLQDLCRMFQQERTSLLAQLNEKNARASGESPKNDESKEKEENSTKEPVSLENNSGKISPTSSIELLEQRLETGSNPSTTTEKKDEVSSEEKVANASTTESPISRESTAADTTDTNQESKDKDLAISPEDRTQESSVKEESSNVEAIVEDSSKTQLSIAESSPVTSTEKLDEKEDVEKENKEAIERVNDTSCDDTTQSECSSEVIENESIVQTSIPEKKDVQDVQEKEEESKTQSSDQEDKNEKLVESVENKCNGVTTPEVESDSTIEQPVSNDLSDKDIPSEPIEASKSEVEVNACDKSQESSAVVENVEETEKSDSQISKDSTEANPVVEKQVKTNNPSTKEDNKSIKQTAPATAKNGRRKRK